MVKKKENCYIVNFYFIVDVRIKVRGTELVDKYIGNEKEQTALGNISGNILPVALGVHHAIKKSNSSDAKELSSIYYAFYLLGLLMFYFCFLFTHCFSESGGFPSPSCS